MYTKLHAVYSMSSGVPLLLSLLTIILGLVLAGAQQPVIYKYNYSSDTVVEAEPGGRIRGIQNRIDKDFVLGGLFPVHSDDSNGTHCNEIRRIFGVDLVEAMLFTIDRINADDVLLPNLILGYDIRETCYIENIGLDEALELAVIGSQRATQLSQCQVESNQTIPTLGIIGAAASRVTIPVASLGRLFEIPQISYASTSTDLSNQRKDRFTFFFRTVVPDDIQAQAQISLVRHFNWNHISVVYSDNAYGSRGRAEIVAFARENNICIELDEGIIDGADQERYKDVADLLNRSKAEVVLLFALDDVARGLLGTFANLTNRHQLTWIASDGWAENEVLIQSFNSTLVGMFGTAPATMQIDAYRDYLATLTIDDNKRDPWFPEFFSIIESCIINSTCNTDEGILNYTQTYAVSRTVEGVYAFAHALQNYLDDNCDEPVKWNRGNYSCAGQKRALNGSTMLEYIGNVSFSSNITGRTVEFNELGYITSGSYDIFNYQSTEDDGRNGMKLVRVGTWQADDRTIRISNTTKVQFGLDQSGEVVSTPHVSKCKTCTPGQYLNSDSSCCGACSPCTGQYHSNDSTSQNCSKCDELMWGNSPTGKDNVGSSFCTSLNSISLQLNHPLSIIMIILSLFGLLAVGIVAVMFAIFWNTPVIKSSGRESMILLLVGIGLSYMLAFIYVSPPVLTVCIIQRIGLWFCFSLMFSSLMIKIIRVARIFFWKFGLKHIPLSAPKYQVLFTFLAVAGQMVLVLGSVLHQYPGVSHNLRLNPRDNNDFATVVVACTPDHLIFIVLSLVYESAIITVTTICGIISFKYPKNFNETKHISLCTFALVVIWLAFLSSYFATATLQEFQNATISLAVIMTASAVLAFNFAPRIFIVVFNPHKKDPNLTTTAPDHKTGISAIPMSEDPKGTTSQL